CGIARYSKSEKVTEGFNQVSPSTANLFPSRAQERAQMGVLLDGCPPESPRSCEAALPQFRMHQGSGSANNRFSISCCTLGALSWNRPGNRTHPGMLHRNTGWMLTSGSWGPGPESRTEPSPRPDRRLRRGGWRPGCGDWDRGTLLGYGKECRMATTSSSLVSGAGAPPIRVGIARVADRPSGGCVALGGSGGSAPDRIRSGL